MRLENLTIAFAPLLPWAALAALAAAAALLLGFGWLRRARGMVWRSLVIAVLLLTLANPSAVIEDRSPLDDIGVVVLDQSPSQSIGQRGAQAEQALAKVQDEAKRLKHFELRVLRTDGRGESLRDSGTELFHALDRALAEIPRQRFAGAVIISDGEVHDSPGADGAAAAAAALGAPVHALLTGERGEGDRVLKVVDAPSYGLVGKPLTMTVRVDDLPGPSQGDAALVIRRDGGEESTIRIPLGKDAQIPIKLDHAGQTILELSVAAGPRELTLQNNRAVVVMNGVRDRLRVLLVSGEPHPGERALRNLLKSDPSVDLVHFTILRPPEKLDATPVRELSLITFPVHELFEVKLNEFDLIIFDRYRRRGELPRAYLQNIVDYVKKGGAMLALLGPSFATPVSFYYSPLAEIVPGEPTGQVLERGFRPKVTELGERHPVTAELPGDDKEHPWGRWFRQIDIRPKGGQTLMTGIDGRPLLQLERIEKGRVALLASDQMWLWSRGYEGGGPQAELLRRLAHWLMKEPELEEEDLRAEVDGDRVKVIRRSLDTKPATVELTSPAGRKRSLPLSPEAGGRASAVTKVDELGVYRISDGSHTTMAVVGPLNPIEWQDVRATEERLAPIAKTSGGSIHWLGEGGVPELRQIRPSRDYAGAGVGGAWMAFKSNGDYVVTGVRQAPLLPALLVLLAALGALALAWRREGR